MLDDDYIDIEKTKEKFLQQLAEGFLSPSTKWNRAEFISAVLYALGVALDSSIYSYTPGYLYFRERLLVFLSRGLGLQDMHRILKTVLSRDTRKVF